MDNKSVKTMEAPGKVLLPLEVRIVTVTSLTQIIRFLTLSISIVSFCHEIYVIFMSHLLNVATLALGLVQIITHTHTHPQGK